MLPIRTPRLIIRAMTVADAARVQAARTHPDNERYQGWRPADVEAVAEHARQQDPDTIGREPGTIQLVIESEGEFVGDFGVSTRDPPCTVELGITLAPAAKGRGIASMATRVLLSALFARGVHRVCARVDPRNEPSLRLFERLGFRREGLEVEAYFDEAYDEWTDEVLFAVLRREWSATRDSAIRT